MAQAAAFTTASPTLNVTSPTDTTATLAISQKWGVKDGSWYYQADKGPHKNSCSSAGSNSSVDLSGLTPGESYTYKAYSDSSCNNLVATAAAFTTLKLAGSDATATTATLTISNWSGDWYYQYTTPAGGTCSTNAVTTTTASLTGLDKATDYTFKAYSDSGCNTEIAAANLATTTPALAVSGVAAQGATLTLSGWTPGTDGNWWYRRTSPNQGACTAGSNTDLSIDLTGLTDGTSYDYMAYSDSNCSSAISSVAHFTTGVSAKLTVFNINTITASLGIIDHTGDWYYKANLAPHTTCSTKQTGQSVNLTGLTEGATYTYTAYGNSGCTTELEPSNNKDQVIFTVGPSVNNLHEGVPHNFSKYVGQSGTVKYRRANGFTTGGAGGGYNLVSISARFDLTVDTTGNDSPGDLAVALYSADSGNPAKPANLLVTLSGSNPTAAGDYTFTCPSNCVLAPSRKYFLVMSADQADDDNQYVWRATTSSTETKVPANNGWSIDNASRYKADDDPWTKPNTSYPAMFKVSFTVRPRLTVSGVTTSAATLNLNADDHSGAWWYKRIVPSEHYFLHQYCRRHRHRQPQQPGRRHVLPVRGLQRQQLQQGTEHRLLHHPVDRRQFGEDGSAIRLRCGPGWRRSHPAVQRLHHRQRGQRLHPGQHYRQD